MNWLCFAVVDVFYSLFLSVPLDPSLFLSPTDQIDPRFIILIERNFKLVLLPPLMFDP